MPVIHSGRAFAVFTDKTTTTPIDIQDNFGPVGDDFPFDGLAYCCPTSVTMSLSYLGVNGFNQLAPLAPTAADGLNLDRVISGMMQTGAINGTAANPFVSAIQNYLAAKGISTANYTLTTYAAPTLSLLNSINTNQTVVDLVFGYYNPSNVRIDGHCVALDNQGVNIQGRSSPATLIINNPKRKLGSHLQLGQSHLRQTRRRHRQLRHLLRPLHHQPRRQLDPRKYQLPKSIYSQHRARRQWHAHPQQWQ